MLKMSQFSYWRCDAIIKVMMQLITQITFYMEWDVQNVQGLPWCFHPQSSLQHFHLSSPFFLSAFTLNILSMTYGSNRQEMSLVPWMRWLFEIQIDQTKLLQPWCEHQLWFLCCALLCLVPWSTYGFADPVSSILGLPKFLVFPKSRLLHAVQIYLTFLHQTATLKSLALFSLELHSYIM